MSKLQDIYTIEAPANAAQINELEGKVWRQPSLSTWEVPEETQQTISGEPSVTER
jgi:hypothetical protein